MGAKSPEVLSTVKSVKSSVWDVLGHFLSSEGHIVAAGTSFHKNAHVVH